MNILFILYGDFTTNTANPVTLFTRELQALGHECVIAVPSGLKSADGHDQSTFIPMLYEEVLSKGGKVFTNKSAPDIVHACTLRIGVVKFLSEFLSEWPAPLVVYLEDNETWIAERYINDINNDLRNLNSKDLYSLLPPSLSNPFEYPFILALSDLVVLIQEKLITEVPAFVPTRVIPWGVDQIIFHPERLPSKYWKDDLNILGDERIIVYHGGLNGFTRPAMLDLCRAIELINLAGVACKLIRTGPNPINFWHELNENAKSYIKDIGVVPKEQLPSILAMADLFVQPGRINPFEDLRLPSKVPEFLSMGRPVILPNVNIADLFVHDSNAILLQIGDPEEISNACLSIFRDDNKKKNLSSGARSFAQEHFEIRKQTRKLEAAYIEAKSTYNPVLTQELWRCLRANGVIAAAIRRANHVFEESLVSKDLLSKQLLLWCKWCDERMHLLNQLIVESGENPPSIPDKLIQKIYHYRLKIKAYLRGIL